jgi:hypothetical protein
MEGGGGRRRKQTDKNRADLLAAELSGHSNGNFI